MMVWFDGCGRLVMLCVFSCMMSDDDSVVCSLLLSGVI